MKNENFKVLLAYSNLKTSSFKKGYKKLINGFFLAPQKRSQYMFDLMGKKIMTINLCLTLLFHKLCLLTPLKCIIFENIMENGAFTCSIFHNIFKSIQSFT